MLAHPLRSRLLGSLRLEGPATATRLARELGTNSGAAAAADWLENYQIDRLTARADEWRAAAPAESLQWRDAGQPALPELDGRPARRRTRPDRRSIW